MSNIDSNAQDAKQDIKGKSWAEIFDEFLNQPPTASLFRLYLLSFLIWNKRIILFLAFDDQPMREKLRHMYEFAPHADLDLVGWFGGVWSVYLGPLIILYLFYVLVFGLKIKDKEIFKSIYRRLELKHLEERLEVLKSKKGLEKLLELYGSDKQKDVLKEYQEFKTMARYFEDFIKLSDLITGNDKNIFKLNGIEDFYYTSFIRERDLYINKFSTHLINYLSHGGYVVVQMLENKTFSFGLTQKGREMYDLALAEKKVKS